LIAFRKAYAERIPIAADIYKPLTRRRFDFCRNLGKNLDHSGFGILPFQIRDQLSWYQSPGKLRVEEPPWRA
jgi:hypothetical protein